jgi:nucleosome binding factor SPN SPT16 subunit
MEGTEKNQSHLHAGGDVDFVMGKSKQPEKDKKKAKKPEEVGEERIKSTFNIAGASSKDHDELKRKREDFAVQLRKKKKEEMFKKKRAFTGEGATNTPAHASV